MNPIILKITSNIRIQLANQINLIYLIKINSNIELVSNKF
jgi:hypothetical protein